MHVEQFLRNRRAWFEVIKHRPTFTAQTTARALHVAPENVAKSILLRANGGYALTVVPAASSVDLSAVKELLKAHRMSLVQESEPLEKFPDCEVGSLPPFGYEIHASTS